MLAAAVATAAAASVNAQVAFGPAQLLPRDETTSVIFRMLVTSDHSGSWFAASLGILESPDTGRTWSTADLNPILDPTLKSYYRFFAAPNVWLVAYCRTDGLMIARSIDKGTTWTMPELSDPDSAWTVGGCGRGLKIRRSPSGVLQEIAVTFGGTVSVARSLDDGVSWSVLGALNPVAGPDQSRASTADLMPGNGGTWVVAWEDDRQSDRRRRILLRRSPDEGMTWEPFITLAEGELNFRPRIATDGTGNWVIAHIQDIVSGHGRVMISYSSDDGQTWSEPARLDTEKGDTEVDSENVRIATDTNGTWVVTYRSDNGLGGTIGNDTDILIASSLDNGRTWTRPAALSTTFGAGENQGQDMREDLVELAATADGTFMAVWTSKSQNVGSIGPLPWGAHTFVAVSRFDCARQPTVGCRAPIVPGRARITLKDSAGGKDRLSWKWRDGEATGLADFGDPTTTTEYVICLYDSAGGGWSLLFEKDIEANVTCAEKPCWQASSKGVRYKDRSRKHRRGAVKVVDLRAGTTGKARIKITANGPTLAPPRLPLRQEGPVVLQLTNLENGVCWEARYTTAKRNTDTHFIAVSD